MSSIRNFGYILIAVILGQFSYADEPVQGGGVDQVAGKALDIGVGSGDRVWVVGTGPKNGDGNQIYRLKDGKFEAVPDKFGTQIAVSPEGNSWAINQNNDIWAVWASNSKVPKSRRDKATKLVELAREKGEVDLKNSEGAKLLCENVREHFAQGNERSVRFEYLTLNASGKLHGKMIIRSKQVSGKVGGKPIVPFDWTIEAKFDFNILTNEGDTEFYFGRGIRVKGSEIIEYLASL